MSFIVLLYILNNDHNLASFMPSRIGQFIYKTGYKVLKPKGRYHFLDSIVGRGKILDVGCGNNSPYLVKTARPDLYYVGIDVGIYNQTTDYARYADRFIITEPGQFAQKIAELPEAFDAVMSVHNLEHCNNYIDVTLAMIKVLKPGGVLYLVFPCEASVNFPSRHGTLNFYDDATHRNLIPYHSFLSLLEANNLDIIFATQRYRPWLLFLLGLIIEPISFLSHRVMRGVWALYGFETIIIARKK